MGNLLVWLPVVIIFIFAAYGIYYRGVRKTIDNLGIAIVVDTRLKILYASSSAQVLLDDSEMSAKLVAIVKEQYSSHFSTPNVYIGANIRCSPLRYKGKGAWLIQLNDALFNDKDNPTPETLIHTIIQAIPDAIGMMDHDLVYQACNQAFVEPLGIDKPEDLLGKRLEDVAAKEIVDKFSASDRNVLNTGEAFLIIDEVVDKNGNKRWIDARKFRFIHPETKKPGLCILARDITDVEVAKKELNQARDNFQKLSMIDPLTQIGNRRMFNEHLEVEWRSHVRNGAPFSLIMCDIDKFKQFNDTFGHVFGDEVLVMVASVFEKVLRRPLDRVFRYGGEEFAFILSNTDSEGVRTVTERIHEGIKQLQIQHNRSKMSELLTVSLGVYTCVPKPNHEPLQAVELVDEALYKAKAEGRNQTVYVGTWYENDSLVTNNKVQLMKN